MTGTVRLWRWRRNPLRRRTDVAEAWLSLAAGLVLVAGAPAAGVGTALAVGDALLAGQGAAQPQRAEVIGRAAVPVVAGAAGRAHAEVRWTGRDGVVRVAHARVDAGAEPGSRVTVWTDDRGRLTGAPATRSEAWLGAGLAGAGVAACVGVAAVGARNAARGRLDARRAAAWERAWAEAAPRWGRRVP
ncbi:Rv1733c family protein [Streptomyces marincola]|uniref:Uncharacterized protein n=1 Tax=Streptomyces marincola TaxID=2878388 RepID=A0A1W7CU45_9ACTN|nr:hypothetical protein [Streptomyces marincola]ARQ67910.1 hypothetical protein CAG99_02815 [Streptomyces marincola]